MVVPPFSSPTYQSAGNALLCPWFKCRALSKSSEVCNGHGDLKWVQTWIAWDCEVWCIVLGLKLMKMCNKKQYIYFICTCTCMFYRSLFVLFLLAIVLSVLRYNFRSQKTKSGTISCLMWNIYLYFIILKLFTNFQNI